MVHIWAAAALPPDIPGMMQESRVGALQARGGVLPQNMGKHPFDGRTRHKAPRLCRARLGICIQMGT